MITIYGSLRSRALRPIWLLRELDAPHEVKTTIQAYRLADPASSTAPFNTADPAFTALNPMGQVPVLVQGDLVMTESVAMTLYLARRAGGPLSAASAQEDAQILQWAFLGVSAIEAPALEILMTYHQRDPGSAQGQAALKAARASLARPLARMQAHLDQSDWLVGARFTVADLVLAEIVRFAGDDTTLFDAWPAVSRWLARARSRPVYAALWAARNAEPDTFPA